MFRGLLTKLEHGRPFTASEFRPLDWSMRHFLRGNFQTFGLWRGFWSNLYLMCPLVNTIRFWHLRNLELSFVDEDGNRLNPLVENALICTLRKRD